MNALWLLWGAQYRLALWWPLIAYLVWTLLVRACRVRSARARFASLLLVTLLPPLVFVAPLSELLRGNLQGVELARRLVALPPDPQQLQADPLLWWLTLWPFLLIPAGMVGAVLLGALEYLVAALRLAFIPRRHEAGVIVLDTAGLGAFTFGLLRPQVYLTRAVWEGPHRAAVLAHELAHARRRDGLWLFLARGIRRSTLYLPLGGRVYAALHLEAERACDEAGVAAVGQRAYARALLDFAGQRGPAVPTAPAFGEPWVLASLLSLPLVQHLATRLPGGWIARRVEALLDVAVGREQLAAFWAAFALMYLGILALT